MEYHFHDEKKFCYKIIKLVSKHTGYSLKEIKSCIKLKNVKTMVRMYSSRHIEGGFTVTISDVSIMCDEIYDWVAGVELARLAAEDVLDAYWDEKSNKMIFKMKKQL